MDIIIKGKKRGDWDFCYLPDTKGYLIHRGHKRSHEYVWWQGTDPEDTLGLGPSMVWLDSTDAPAPGPGVMTANLPPGEFIDDDDHELYNILIGFARQKGLSICEPCGGIGHCFCVEIKEREDRQQADEKAHADKMASILSWGSEAPKNQGAGP